MTRTTRGAWHAAMVAILMSTACQDQAVVAPAATAGPASFNQSPGAPGTRANHSMKEKYREQTHPFSSGHSRSATVSSRALLGKDGVTTLDLTTGTLDVPGAPGEFQKITIQPFSTTAHKSKKIKANKVNGPTYTTTLAGLPVHDSLGIDARVTGIDKQPDDVAFTEVVRRRPDVSVTMISSTPNITLGETALISADIGELNGDVGAHTDCVLSIDGTEAGRIAAMWVADGDHVTCQFDYVFATTGTHTVRISADKVVPGDWDTANNAASTSVTVTDTELAMGSISITQSRDTLISVTSEAETDLIDGVLSWQGYTWSNDTTVHASQMVNVNAHGPLKLLPSPLPFDPETWQAVPNPLTYRIQLWADDALTDDISGASNTEIMLGYTTWKTFGAEQHYWELTVGAEDFWHLGNGNLMGDGIALYRDLNQIRYFQQSPSQDYGWWYQDRVTYSHGDPINVTDDGLPDDMQRSFRIAAQYSFLDGQGATVVRTLDKTVPLQQTFGGDPTIDRCDTRVETGYALGTGSGPIFTNTFVDCLKQVHTLTETVGQLSW